MFTLACIEDLVVFLSKMEPSFDLSMTGRHSFRAPRVNKPCWDNPPRIPTLVSRYKSLCTRTIA